MKEVASALLRMAKTLMAKADDLRVTAYLHRAYSDLMDDLEKQIKSEFKGIRQIQRTHRAAREYNMFMSGYAASDIAATATLSIIFEGEKFEIHLSGKRSDWSDEADMMNWVKGEGVLPVRRIAAHLAAVFT